VHELVYEDVIADGWWHQDEAPVQRDLSVAAAGSPSCALIADAHTRDGQAVLGGYLEQPRRQFRARTIAERRSLFGPERRWSQPGPLPCDPLGVTLHELVGLALRSAAGNRHADAAVMFDTQKVSARAPMTDEVDRSLACRCDWSDACRCDRPIAWRCESALACRCARIVNKRQAELHERQDNRSPGSFYCVRSAVRGLTVLARRAGNHTAISETMVSARGITMNTTGSRAST
jgi:hypothetical protein